MGEQLKIVGRFLAATLVAAALYASFWADAHNRHPLPSSEVTAGQEPG